MRKIASIGITSMPNTLEENLSKGVQNMPLRRATNSNHSVRINPIIMRDRLSMPTAKVDRLDSKTISAPAAQTDATPAVLTQLGT